MRKTIVKNVSLPSQVMAMADRITSETGESFSGLLHRLILQESRASDPMVLRDQPVRYPSPKAPRGKTA